MKLKKDDIYEALVANSFNNGVIRTFDNRRGTTVDLLVSFTMSKAAHYELVVTQVDRNGNSLVAQGPVRCGQLCPSGKRVVEYELRYPNGGVAILMRGVAANLKEVCAAIQKVHNWY